jgi:hypothetical protein
MGKKRARKVHAVQVGRRCPTVNEAALRGYELRATATPEEATCRTCVAHLVADGLRSEFVATDGGVYRATYERLDSDAWGIRVSTAGMPPLPGDYLHVRARDGRMRMERITRVLSVTDRNSRREGAVLQVAICEIARTGRAHGA